MSKLKTVFPNIDFVIEDYVDPRAVARRRLEMKADNETHGEGTAIDWGTFPGQSIAVGPCGPGEHSSKLIRSRRSRQARRSTGLARDIRQLPERFTLEAKGERLLIRPVIGT